MSPDPQENHQGVVRRFGAGRACAWENSPRKMREMPGVDESRGREIKMRIKIEKQIGVNGYHFGVTPEAPELLRRCSLNEIPYNDQLNLIGPRCCVIFILLDCSDLLPHPAHPAGE